MQNIDFGRFIQSSGVVCVENVLDAIRSYWERSIPTLSIEVAGSQISLVSSRTGQGGYRYWFVCPITGYRCQKLYVEPSGKVGSRRGLGIRYPSKSQKGMIEEVARRQLKMQ